MRNVIGAVIGGAVFIGSTLTLSGCTVPPGGRSTLFVGPDGQPWAAVAMCEGRINGGILWPHSDRDSQGFEVTWSWDFDEWVTDSMVWPLVGDSPGVTLTKPFEGFITDDDPYSFYAGSNNNEWSTFGPTFTAEEFAALAPGDVLSDTPGMTVDEFLETACDDWFHSED